MASTEELEAQILAEMESNPEAYADTGTEYCTVDDDTRLVTVPDKYKKLGVESDEKAKRIWFRFPKLVGNNGVDLSAIGVRVNFRNANGDGDIYIVEDLTTDGDYVIFSWELTRKVTAYKGNVSFVVCAVKSATDGTTKNEWNTTLNKECEVLEGLEVTERIEQENPDIIEYILANLGGSVSAEEIATAVEEYMAAHPFTETDPTVPDWAKQPEKPTYNASEVGADASGTAESKVSEHNVATDAHNDIRLLIEGLTTRLNALADSDDTTLDQMSEVVAYIKSNKSLIDAITTSKVSVSDIIDNLTTNVSNKPLSAAQGVDLKALIDGITIPEKLPNPQKLTFSGAVTAEYDGSGAVTVTIPDSRTIRVEQSDAEAALEPGKLYVFPEMAELTITLAAPTDTAVASEYHFVFQSGATATSLSLPDTIKLPSGFTVDASKIYEISILEECLCAQSWAVS